MPEEFDWSLGEAGTTSDESTESAAEGEDQAEDAAVEGDQAPRDRDERGRFAPRQSDGDGEGADADAEQDGQGPDDALILGKFKSNDDLVRAYQEAERRLGEQGSEVGTLRQELAELRGMVQSRTDETSQAPLTDDLVSQVDELAEQNPQQAAVWALQHQPLLYNRVMQIWAGSDFLSASRFERALEREQLKHELREEIGPTQQTVAENRQQDEFNQAWAKVATQYPDMTQQTQGMLEVAEKAPELAQAMLTGNMATKERLIENLYWLYRGQRADTIAAAATQLGREEAERSVQDKAAATVASGSSTQARGEKTPIEQWKEEVFLRAPATSIFAGQNAR